MRARRVWVSAGYFGGKRSIVSILAAWGSSYLVKKIASVGAIAKKIFGFTYFYSNLTYSSSGCSSKNSNVAGQSQPFIEFS